MPKVDDHQDKDELFNKISTKLTSQSRLSRKKRSFPWLVPSLASVVVVFIIIVIAQNISINNQASQSNDAADDSANFSTFEQQESSELPPLSDGDNEDEETSLKEAEENQTDADAQGEGMTIMNSPVSNVVQKDENVTVIHAAALDSNVNQIIPISLVDKSTTNAELESYYNNINEYIDEKTWGVIEFPFEDITFDINEDVQEVVVHIPEDYQFGGGGGAIQGKFDSVISMMFRPYNIETATIDFNGQQLGMFGELDNFPISTATTQVYKIYQTSVNHPEFLVPIDTDKDFQGALDEMKLADPDPHINAPIPSDVEVIVESLGPLSLTIQGPEGRLGNDKETLNMIEAILMTAKTFQLDSVSFDMTIDHVGPYDLTMPVPVPEAVNPIQIK